jgi:hypothetical protein
MSVIDSIDSLSSHIPYHEPTKGGKAWKFVADPALKKNVSPQASATLTALKKKYKSLQGAVDAGWRASTASKVIQ